MRSGLQRHLKHECGVVPSFGCAHCDHHTSQKSNLIKHLARSHNIPKKLVSVVCPKCNKSYKNECTLRRHQDVECGQNPMFNCKLCHYSTKRKYSLKMHINRKHNVA
ncbi:zinc finger X-chromosomal protein-like [Copidosoma floridanum]|uniref:zinc finger X-chromosomal protein-like n=1 Tax=Copidosoma floridanum TaxID=29053 RepID=UPI0006C96D31|nr:zinc finger X-chromosomal protein-like [Copidosoma floridanum]